MSILWQNWLTPYTQVVNGVTIKTQSNGSVSQARLDEIADRYQSISPKPTVWATPTMTEEVG